MVAKTGQRETPFAAEPALSYKGLLFYTFESKGKPPL
jgi:hypothetical protein